MGKALRQKSLRKFSINERLAQVQVLLLNPKGQYLASIFVTLKVFAAVM